MQQAGIWLLLTGVAVALGYLSYAFVATAFVSVPWPLKAAIVAGGLGFLLILGSLARERWKTSKEERDKFKGVDR